MQMALSTLLLAIIVFPVLALLAMVSNVSERVVRMLGNSRFVQLAQRTEALTRLRLQPEFSQCSDAQLHAIAVWHVNATDDDPMLVLLEVPGAAGEGGGDPSKEEGSGGNERGAHI